MTYTMNQVSFPKKQCTHDYNRNSKINLFHNLAFFPTETSMMKNIVSELRTKMPSFV